MNRVWIGAVVSLAVGVGVILNTQQVLSADQATVVTGGGPCGIFFSDDDGLSFGGIGEVTLLLENDNKVMMKCEGTGLENPTGIGQHFAGFSCGIVTPEGVVFETEDTHGTVSADGTGTMTCTFRK